MECVPSRLFTECWRNYDRFVKRIAKTYHSVTYSEPGEKAGQSLQRKWVGHLIYTSAISSCSKTTFLNLKMVERLSDGIIRDESLSTKCLSGNQQAYWMGHSTEGTEGFAIWIFIDIEGAFRNALRATIEETLRCYQGTRLLRSWVKAQVGVSKGHCLQR